MWWLAACTPPPAPSPDHVDVAGPSTPLRSRPLEGGAADDDGHTLLAADTDGDRLVLVDWSDGRVRTVGLPVGAAPTRVAVDAGFGAAIARGPGAVVTVELATLHTTWVPVCPEPRGVDVRGQTAWVTCADGQWVEVTDGAVVGRWWVEPELGDLVVDADGGATIAVRRAAEVVRVDPAGEVVERYHLPAPTTPDGRAWEARAARRLVATGDGRVAVLAQAHTTAPIPLGPSSEPVYGTGACDAAARPLVAWVGADGVEATVRVDAVLPVELGFWPEGDGAFDEPTPVVGAVSVGPGRGVQVVYPPSGLAEPEVTCVARGVHQGTDGWVTGVGAGPDGPYAVTRAPFAVVDAGGSWVEAEPTPVNAGWTRFHEASPSGLTCATCHVDGEDDGHTWQFDGLGPRRTPSLAVPLTAPYHWSGDLADLGALWVDTAEVRMGATPATADEIDALQAWLDALPRPLGTTPTPASDRGADVFDRSGCPACHPAPDYTRAAPADVGTGGVFEVPSLVGVGRRLPVMHDGCATTLDQRFEPGCGGSAHGPALSDADRADLITFLDTL